MLFLVDTLVEAEKSQILREVGVKLGYNRIIKTHKTIFHVLTISLKKETLSCWRKTTFSDSERRAGVRPFSGVEVNLYNYV